MPFKQIHLNKKQDLIQLIRNTSTLIEQGVEILGGPIGTEEFPLIDLVMKDRNRRPLLILADVGPDENALLNAESQSDWFVKNLSMLRQLFPILDLNKTVSPRAALIYPEFPMLMKRSLRAAPLLSPLFYQYRCFEVLDQRFLYLERFQTNPEKQGSSGEYIEGLHPFRKGLAGKEVEITAEEREAFLS
ncbi:MAG: hypothetical protein CO150_04405 [Nitrospirae bacterium CG_4_9_14_3_um_filter_53_35]|nr:MAG: hypothetical protein AUK29_00890 [Nitrospirae bacterium CG2_30_53_67]PIS38574.1 MAG: hypothetical protein COT35_00110 [Nitrospirae bacterium CG08_land_8_20_14_0_20_52_24]PIV83890.1 MAG: hypothetical protein COW52_08205 [Nitrospirae bacterium CG17_big_fil_post_rev_8_21_14_2_50_50_9]PIW84378.1 MAG: hypothetical protein COZ95_10065 [Nitrospirae bacterium CG_4_8_14_3_um_filter_50_41]PIX86522.1 MAG: hypothetical protein COZ32_02885 [Nitrospirae bacterium CG_4_10_14_3_um_filter_53_41]PJA7554